jgi:hypothetical protein
MKASRYGLNFALIIQVLQHGNRCASNLPILGLIFIIIKTCIASFPIVPALVSNGTTKVTPFSSLCGVQANSMLTYTSQLHNQYSAGLRNSLDREQRRPKREGPPWLAVVGNFRADWLLGFLLYRLLTVIFDCAPSLKPSAHWGHANEPSSMPAPRKTQTAIDAGLPLA